MEDVYADLVEPVPSNAIPEVSLLPWEQADGLPVAEGCQAPRRQP